MIKCEIKDNSKQEGKAPFKGSGNGDVELRGNFTQIMNETGMLIAAVIESYEPVFKAITQIKDGSSKAMLEMKFLKTIEFSAMNYLTKRADKTVDMSNLHTFLNNQRGGNDDD